MNASIIALNSVVENSVFMAVELIEPKLILPSFARRFNEIRRKYERVYHLNSELNRIAEFTQSFDGRLEFAKEMVILIKMLIGNSHLAEKFFAMRYVKWPFTSAPISHENIIYYLLMEDYPQPMPILFHMSKLVVQPNWELNMNTISLPPAKRCYLRMNSFLP